MISVWEFTSTLNWGDFGSRGDFVTFLKIVISAEVMYLDPFFQCI